MIVGITRGNITGIVLGIVSGIVVGLIAYVIKKIGHIWGYFAGITVDVMIGFIAGIIAGSEGNFQCYCVYNSGYFGSNHKDNHRGNIGSYHLGKKVDIFQVSCRVLL